MSKFIEVPFGSEGPKGEKGDAATVAVGTVTTLPAGSPATVENTGTSSAAVLNFGIPKGQKGDTGTQKQADWAQTDTSAEDYIKNKPAIPVVPTKVSAFDNDAGYLTEHQDMSGKANLSGGNSFSGKQQFTETNTNGTAAIGGDNGYAVVKVSHPQGGNAVNIANNTNNHNISINCGLDGTAEIVSSGNGNIKVNDEYVFKTVIPYVFSDGGNLHLNTGRYYNLVLNGGVNTLVLPVPSDTSRPYDINIFLKVTAQTSIAWRGGNANQNNASAISANSCITSFDKGKYEIKLGYDVSTSNWTGEVLKANENIPSKCKVYYSFNGDWADETYNTILTPVTGYSPNFSKITTAFTGRKSLTAGIGFTPVFNTPLVLSGKFNIKFRVQATGNDTFCLLGKPSDMDDNILYCASGNLVFNAPLAASGSSVSNVFSLSATSLLSGRVHYVEISRDEDNYVRVFVDGFLKNTVSFTQDIYIRPEKVFYGTNAYIQDFAIEDDSGHTSGYTVPTSIPYPNLFDYHDDTKQNNLNSSQLSAVNSGIDTIKVAQIGTNTSSISTINGKIPSAASPSNQLADKEFVNSSVATNTAYFKGTFSSVAALLAYSGDITNNDYAFVTNSVIQDNGNDWSSATDLNNYNKASLTNKDYAWVINGSNFDLYVFDIVHQQWVLTAANTSKITQPTAYNRYKAIVSDDTVTWSWEYTLNNSSFTAAQWAAINSGITAALVSLIGTALQSVPYATASRIGGIKIEKDTVNGIINIIDED